MKIGDSPLLFGQNDSRWTAGKKKNCPALKKQIACFVAQTLFLARSCRSEIPNAFMFQLQELKSLSQQHLTVCSEPWSQINKHDCFFLKTQAHRRACTAGTFFSGNQLSQWPNCNKQDQYLSPSSYQCITLCRAKPNFSGSRRKIDFLIHIPTFSWHEIAKWIDVALLPDMKLAESLSALLSPFGGHNSPLNFEKTW